MKRQSSSLNSNFKVQALAEVPAWPLLVGANVGLPLSLELLALGLLPSSLWLSPGVQLSFTLSLGLLLGLLHLALYLHWVEPRLRRARAEARHCQQRHQSLLQKVSQVGHDIQSPLTALNLILGQWPHLPLESKRLLQNTIHRIQKIASDLHPNPPKKAPWLKASDLAAVPVSLNGLLENLIQEKQVEYQGQAQLEITWQDQSAGGVELKWESCTLSRVLSNLINNAVEAGAPQVNLILKEEKGRIQILVQDNGRGLPENLKLGLGLSHALKVVEEWGGKLQFESQLDRGTTVRLTLPRTQENKNLSLAQTAGELNSGKSRLEIYSGQPIPLSPSPARIS